jgi:RHS repeat-associated protein
LDKGRARLGDAARRNIPPAQFFSATVAGAVYTYDLDGNLAGDGVWSYGHDAEGRLVSATRAGTALAYGYDALGRRRSRSVNGARTDFLLSGDQEMAEYNASGALLRRFVWGPAGPDDIVALIGATGGVAARRRFHHLDGLGSTVALTDSTGAVVERYPATAFGVGDSNAGLTPWRFTGRRLDPETGFYHLRARDYAPMIGRFVQPDPIGVAGGINLYAYVGNDPLNRTDPWGLVAPAIVAAGVGGAVGGALDFGLQLLSSGGRLSVVSWSQVATAALAGAALSGLGPSGWLLGRGGARAASYGYTQSAGLINRGYLRFGWGYRGADDREVLRLGVGRPHYDVPVVNLRPGANPIRDGAVAGTAAAGVTAAGDVAAAEIPNDAPLALPPLVQPGWSRK